MKCRKCNDDKLSKEFPPVTVSEKCQHPPLVCLQVSLVIIRPSLSAKQGVLKYLLDLILHTYMIL